MSEMLISVFGRYEKARTQFFETIFTTASEGENFYYLEFSS